mmetsp:Transcript_10970/g.29448  ORF Transcript_10970/g.29448 Transcript_10970/m.29448 type:complete len:242 (-) Transcript_10970:414-1139(-)
MVNNSFGSGSGGGNSGAQQRVKGRVFVQPVVCGSVSQWLGPDADQFRSHRWRVYLRGVRNEDLSFFIDHVEFVLHETLQPPVRIVRSPPYEVEEYGWGEFEIIVRIHFVDKLEKPLDLFHFLRLFPTSGARLSQEPVVSEQYDEVILSEPPEALLRIMRAGPRSKRGKGGESVKTDLERYFTDVRELEKVDMQAISAARDTVQLHSSRIQSRLADLEREREQLMDQIAQIDPSAAYLPASH